MVETTFEDTSRRTDFKVPSGNHHGELLRRKSSGVVDLDTLEKTRQAYLEAHPEWGNFKFETTENVRPAPTPGEVHAGTYAHDKFNTQETPRNISAEDEPVTQ